MVISDKMTICEKIPGSDTLQKSSHQNNRVQIFSLDICHIWNIQLRAICQGKQIPQTQRFGRTTCSLKHSVLVTATSENQPTQQKTTVL